MSDLVIVGAGGHGRELFATVEAINQVSPTWNVLGFVDDAPTHPERVERLGSVVLGGLDWLVGQEVSVAVGIGTSSVRRAVIERLSLSPDRTPRSSIRRRPSGRTWSWVRVWSSTTAAR